MPKLMMTRSMVLKSTRAVEDPDKKTVTTLELFDDDVVYISTLVFPSNRTQWTQYSIERKVFDQLSENYQKVLKCFGTPFEEWSYERS